MINIRQIPRGCEERLQMGREGEAAGTLPKRGYHGSRRLVSECVHIPVYVGSS